LKKLNDTILEVFAILEEYMQIEILTKKIRKNKKITLKKLALLSGISTTQLNDIENNLKIPTIVTLECIASALNVDVKETYIIKN